MFSSRILVRPGTQRVGAWSRHGGVRNYWYYRRIPLHTDPEVHGSGTHWSSRILSRNLVPCSLPRFRLGARQPVRSELFTNRSDTRGEGSQKQQSELSSLNSTQCMFNGPMANNINGTLDTVVKDAAQALLGNSTVPPPGNSTGEAVEKTSAILFVVGVITSRVGTSSATSC